MMANQKQNAKRIVWLMVLLTLCCLSTASFATNYYVSRNGNNSGGTSWATAWSEFDQISWGSVQAGDTIYVDGGSSAMTYNSLLNTQSNGTSSAPIKIRRSTDSGHNGTVYMNGQIKIWSSNITLDGVDKSRFVINPTDSMCSVFVGYWDADASGSVVANLTIQGTYATEFGISMGVYSANTTVRSCRFVQSPGEDQLGVLAEGNVLVEYCEFTGQKDSGTIVHRDVLSVHPGTAPGSKLTIRYNNFHDAETDTIIVIPYEGTRLGSLEIYGNAFTNLDTSIKLDSARIASMDACNVYNNTFTNVGITMVGLDYPGVNFTNNTIDGSGPAPQPTPPPTANPNPTPNPTPRPVVAPAPSVIGITRIGTNPAPTSSVNYMLTFSQAVTGVDPSDFRLVASGLSGASISSINATPKGNIRSIIVNTGSGNGTLRLDLVDNDSIKNTAGVPLGGRGSGNGNFSGCETYTISRSAVGPYGLVARYKFDEYAGNTAFDISGRGNNGTVKGAIWAPNGKSGSTLVFDGASNWVTVNDSASLDLTSGMTIEAWVYPLGAMQGWKTVVQKEATGGASYYMHANSAANRPAIGVQIGSERILYSSSAIPANSWSHITVTYSGTTMRFYVNGVQVASQAQTGSIAASSGALRIGGNSAWGEYFKGGIDEVRIYNRALSAAEIQADMK